MRDYKHYCSKDFILEGKPRKPMATLTRRISDVEIPGLLTPLIKGLKWFFREITIKNPEY